MYKKFFGLQANPFSVNPDPRFLFMTKPAQEALVCLSYGIHTRRGFILLTGEVGTGKTTLLNRLMVQLQQHQVRTSFVFNPRLDVDEFFHFMLADFGLNLEVNAKKSTVLLRFNQWLLERYRAGEHVALIIDEAQDLSDEVLEEIRLLTNLETSTEKLLQIVLCGQPELEEKLNRQSLRQLRQRITLRSRTHALAEEETRSYIAQRLAIAGMRQQTLFGPEAVHAVHVHSQGIPRVINLLCEHALISAFADQQKSISPATIQAVAREFELNVAPSPVQPLGEEDNEALLEAFRSFNTLARRWERAAAAVPQTKGGNGK